MSRDVLAQVVARAIGDAAFRQLLRTNPSAALREFKLSPDERSAITSGDPAKLTALGVDQRMSRMFILPDEVGGFASRTDASDASVAPRADIDAGVAGTGAAARIPSVEATSQLGRIEGMLDVGAAEPSAIDAGPGGELDLSQIDAGAPTLSGSGLVAPPVDEFRTAAATLASEAEGLDLSMIDAGSKDAVSAPSYAPEEGAGEGAGGVQVPYEEGAPGASVITGEEDTGAVEGQTPETQITGDVEPTEF